MKKQFKTLVTVCALLTVTAMEANAAMAEKISIVPVLGGNSFNYGGSGMDSRGGTLAGANVYMSTGVEGLQLETGLNYLETGAKTNMLFVSAEKALGYIAIPVLANWQFYKTSGGTELFLKGGAYITQLMSAKLKMQGFGGSAEEDIKSQISNNDVLVTAGFGGRWTVFSNLQAALDLNYAQGLIKTEKDGTGKSSGLILGTSLIIPL
ncbi:outer membrane beta-barrel protein [Bdellovibrio sp. HCB337]|uniref:outer membrane beta-barrel protein n=1 Tax=Bdellovibrio sp. HCB337 TaxID=3394358 RepID=UPI0039A4CA95